MEQSNSEVTITSNIARQFIAVQQTGACNMFDPHGVKETARKLGHTDLAEFVEQDSSRLGPIVFGDAMVEHNDEVLTMSEWMDLHDL